jgi:membrane-associated phospholipid phosphatase
VAALVRSRTEPAVPERNNSHLRAVAWFAALAGVTVLASRPKGGWMNAIDASLAGAVVQRRSATAIRAAHAVSAVAEPEIAMVPLVTVAVIAARRRGWQAACQPCVTVLAGMALRRRLSRLVARPRPPAASWLIEPEGFSLPSKHTCLAALTAGACATALDADRLSCDAAVVAAAAGVGVSRICLGVHWPTDVLAGWLFAAGWLDLVRVVTRRGRARARLVPGRTAR